MESTTVITFTTTATATVTIVQSTWSDHTIKFDGTELALSMATTPEGSEGVRVYTISGVPAGDHTITRDSGESGVLYIAVVTGSTTVPDPEPDPVEGDLDGSGTLDETDVTALVNHLTGQETPEGFDPVAADINNDGDVNIADLAALIAAFLSAHAQE